MIGKQFSRSFYANKQAPKKPSANRSSQPFMPRSRPHSQAGSIRGGSVTSNESINFDLMLNDGQIFPQDVLILLGEEERNIMSFKDRIERQKSKIENDFSNFKREIQHITEDLKISMQAELDRIYRYFIERYASLKSEVQQIKKIKKEIESQATDSQYDKLIPMNSNKQLIKEITKDSKNYRAYRIQNYITELQKKRISPLLELSKEIILMQTSNQSYYVGDATSGELSTLKHQVSHFVNHMFQNLGKYVNNPSTLFQNNLISEISIMSDKKDPQQNFIPTREVQSKQFMVREFQPSKEVYKDFSVESSGNFRKVEVPQVITRSAYTNFDNQRFQPREIQSINYARPVTMPLPPPLPKKFRISQSEQILSMGWVEDLKLNFYKTIHTDHSTILCALVINSQYIATGGKDSIINVFTLEGMKIATLKAHTASVCTLSTINNAEGKTTMLVSGSDVGCSTLVFWDINSWTVRSKIHAHSAAITSIVDLGDSQTVVSGSYDKLINVYNHRRAEVLYNLSANKSNVTGIVLSSDKNRLTSCGLDKSLCIWKVSRRAGLVESIQLQRIIQNDVMICSLNASMLRHQIVITGTKDGRIKFWNLDSGQCQRTLTANNSAIIELIVVQRESKPNYPIILSCSSKDRSLVLTNTQNLINSLFQVDDKLNIQLGCGIGPKVVFDKMRGSPIMVLVSQSSQRREVNIFQMDFK